MSNPFEILNLHLLEAKALKQLSVEGRRHSLNMLRRYYGSILHPDVTLQQEFGLAEVNAAIDDLLAESKFTRYYQSIVSGKTGGGNGYLTSLQHQVEFLKAKLTESEAKVKEKSKESQVQMGHLQIKLLKVSRELSNAEKKTAVRLLPELQKIKRNRIELKKEMAKQGMTLRSHILTLLQDTRIPNGTYRLSELANKRLEGKAGFFDVSHDLIVTHGQRRSGPTTSVGRLIGGLSAGLAKGSRVSIGSVGYDRVLLNLKPYYQAGMVLVIKRRTDLHLYRSKMWMVENEQVTTA